MPVDASNLPDLARGCAVLAAGGGGDPELGHVVAMHAILERGPVALVAPGDLAPDAVVMPCGQLGSPTIAAERVWSGDEGAALCEAVERVRGTRVDALMCLQIGGANGLLPVAWAARLGLPLVDADGVGRGFPTLPQTAMHLAGVAAAPVFLADGRDNTVVLHPAGDRWAEHLARGAVASLGGVCAVAAYCMTGAEVGAVAIAGSVSHAIALGARHGRPGTALIEGRVLDVQRRAGDGFVRGAATVQGLGADAGRQLRLELQNELLLALEDGEVRAAVPDVITVLAAETGEPVTTERLRYGQRVVVIACPAPDVWRTDAGLALAGPAAFGYDLGRVPLPEEAVHADA